MTETEQLGTENTEGKQEVTANIESTAEEVKTDAKDAEEIDQDAEKLDETEENTEEGQEEPVKVTKKSASDTIRALKAERNAEREERDKLIAEKATYQAQLDALRQQQIDAQTASQRQEEEKRLELLDPTERKIYELDKQSKQLTWQLNQLNLQRMDDDDRAKFHAKAGVDEVYGKYADQVEKMYQEGLARGVSASREDLHSFILGKELKKDLSNKTSEKRKAAGQKIAAVTSKAPSGKSDVSGAKKGKTPADRLEGVII